MTALVPPLLGSAGLLVAAAVLSPRRPLWYDEIATRMLVTDPSVGHMLSAMLAGVESAPPLYHLIARAWISLFGSSELALRMLSSAGMVIALWAVWGALRRMFTARSAALGALAIFGTSALILRQNHELRFYGVWMAFCTLAVYCCVRMLETPRPERRILAAAALAHAAAALTHTLGVLYVGVLCLAVITVDVAERRFRPVVYGTYVIGILAFLPWVGPTITQSALGSARSWIPVPGIGGFLPAYQFGMAALPLVLLAVVLLKALAAPPDDDAATPPAIPPASGRVATAIAVALFTVPVLLFAISHLVRPLFIDRYMLPSIVGWAFVIAMIADSRIGNPALPGFAATDGRTRRTIRRLPAVGLWALVGGVAAFPVLMALSTPRLAPPASGLHALRSQYAETGEPMPVAVESGLSFLALRHYDEPGGEEYLYPTDEALALDGASPSNAAAFDQYLRMLREHYSLEGVIEPSDLLCSTRRFVVLDGPWLWFERHVADDPAFVSREIGRLDEEIIVRLVERIQGTTPSGCG